jgi:hypothetical protein
MSPVLIFCYVQYLAFLVWAGWWLNRSLKKSFRDGYRDGLFDALLQLRVCARTKNRDEYVVWEDAIGEVDRLRKVLESAPLGTRPRIKYDSADRP